MIAPKTPLILIVDDSPQNLQSLGKILMSQGYDAATAQTSQEAFNFIDNQIPSLIFLSLSAPQVDGPAICKRLKSGPNTRNIPILFILTQPTPSNKELIFKAGGADYIMTPFMAEEILARTAVQIKLQEALKNLSERAITDEMTGVYNRRFAYRILNRQMEVTRREKHHFVLGLVEIDDLKIINDKYGHEQGDYVIMTIIQGLQEAIRLTDYIFRLGGDEFLVLLVHTDITEADKIIARLRKKFNQHYIHDFSIDFSYGFAEYAFQDPTSADGLIKKAETMMNIDKKDKQNKSEKG